MLAFVVGVAVGTKGATDDVSAATGTIDALNVGTCTTTNADDFALGDCSQIDAFFRQGELEDLIEVETLYGTYAHDPSTAAEAPRAILTDGDLLMISITDSGRDRRDPVLVTTAAVDADNTDPFGWRRRRHREPQRPLSGVPTWKTTIKLLTLTNSFQSAGYRSRSSRMLTDGRPASCLSSKSNLMVGTDLGTANTNTGDLWQLRHLRDHLGTGCYRESA